MTQPIYPNIVGSYFAGREQGEQRRDRNRLRELMGPAMQGDESAFGELAGISPQHAQLAQQSGERRDAQLYGAARYMKQALATNDPNAVQGAWKAVRPFLAKFGQPPPENFDPAMVPMIEQVLAKYAYLEKGGDGKPAQQQYAEWLLANAPPEERDQVMGVLGGYRARPSSAGIQFGEMQLGDMKTYANRKNPRTGELEVLTDSGWQPVGGGMESSSAPAPSGGMPDIMGFANDVRLFGGRITSGYRSQEEQDALIAQGRTKTRSSQHTDSTGFDVVFPNPQAKAQSIARARALGINALDEGNHVHFGIPRAAYRGGGLPSVASPTPGQIKADEVVGSEQAKVDVQVANADVIRDLEARLAAAKAQAEAEAKARGEIAAEAGKRSSKAGRVLALLDEADRLIDGSTGSGIGAKRDEAAGFFGQSTPGAENIAALRTLEGQLIAEMPRMEGPQSDADRLLYARAAGTLADPTIPVPQRKAASAQIRRLQERYAGNDSSGPAGKYRVGQVIEHGGKRYRVTGGDMNDPDVEEVQ